MLGDPLIAHSAFRRGISEKAILHAFHHPVDYVEQDDNMLMFIGPDHAGNLYEIGIVDTDGGR